MASTHLASTPVEYPESDGKPLGETGVHVEAIFALLDVLRNHYRGRPDASVLADMFLYYSEGHPSLCVCPDVFLTLGVPDNRFRRTFKVWEEGKAPDLVVEVSSLKTIDDDLGRKLAIYRDILKVREYFLFDPEAYYLDPPLVGYRLIGGEYQPIRPVAGRLPSEVMGVHLEADLPHLRLFNPQTGRYVPSTADQAHDARAEADEARAEAHEARAEAHEARAEADEARARANQAEAGLRERERELEQLRRELERLRGGSGGGRSS